MLLRIVLGVGVGGGIGLAIGYLGKSAGGQCPIACNPYISTGLGVVIGLIFASRGGTADALVQSPNVLKLASDEQYRQAVLNARQAPAATAEQGINAVPAALLIKDGQVVEKLTGLKSETELAALLDGHLANADAHEPNQDEAAQGENRRS